MLINVICQLHQGFKLKLNIDAQHKMEVDYTVGVRQDDNMVPILFLFLMQAFNKSYAKHNPPPPNDPFDTEFCYHQTTATPPVAIFGTSPTQLEHMAQLFDLTRHFLLMMLLTSMEHALKDMKQLVNCWYTFADSVSSCMLALLMPMAIRLPSPKLKQCTAELDAAKADLVFGDKNELYIPFTDCFKYLGSCIHESLCDDVEIDYRLQQATQQATALQNFWNLTVDPHTKRQMFLAIPVNTAFYGCESWTLTANL